MVLLFGPPGAGKSVQGQILAARNGWRWLSAGQLLRDAKNIDLLKQMQTGALVPSDEVNKLMGEALDRATNVSRVILDGFPRQLSQAEWLISSRPQHEREIGLVIVLEVPRAELLKRLEVRGRVDDTPEVIDERLHIYRQEIYPILSYLTEKGVRTTHIDGTGTVGQVHDRIMEELETCKLT